PQRLVRRAVALQADVVGVPQRAGHSQVDWVGRCDAERLLVASYDGLAVRVEQGVARDVLEVPVVVSLTGVELEPPDLHGLHRVAVAVDELYGAHGGSTAVPESLDVERAGSRIPDRRAEVEEVVAALALVAHRKAVRRQCREVGEPGVVACRDGRLCGAAQSLPLLLCRA